MRPRSPLSARSAPSWAPSTATSTPTTACRCCCSPSRYEQVIDAYIAGLARRLTAGQLVNIIASVASFFVSRVDAKADALLPAGSDLRGRVAIANAHRADGPLPRTPSSGSR